MNYINLQHPASLNWKISIYKVVTAMRQNGINSFFCHKNDYRTIL